MGDWSPERESNPRPHSYQECALPLSHLGGLTSRCAGRGIRTPEDRSVARFTVWCDWPLRHPSVYNLVLYRLEGVYAMKAIYYVEVGLTILELAVRVYGYLLNMRCCLHREKGHKIPSGREEDVLLFLS